MTLILPLSSGYTLIVDGRLEELQFDALSHVNTDGIISELSAKLGKPTSVTRFTATPSGVAFPAIHAEWQLRNLHVSYRTVDYRVDYGALLIETPVMQRVRRAHEQEQDAQRTTL